MITVDRAIEAVDDTWENVGFDPRALSPTFQVVHLIVRLQSEVIMGGVFGWLVNSSGQYGPETVKAFEAVGAPHCSAIVQQILAFFPEGAPAAEDEERVRQIMDVEPVAGPHWRELGNRLLTWPDDIYVLLEKFINEHEAEFN